MRVEVGPTAEKHFTMRFVELMRVLFQKRCKIGVRASIVIILLFVVVVVGVEDLVFFFTGLLGAEAFHLISSFGFETFVSFAFWLRYLWTLEAILGEIFGGFWPKFSEAFGRSFWRLFWVKISEVEANCSNIHNFDQAFKAILGKNSA